MDNESKPSKPVFATTGAIARKLDVAPNTFCYRTMRANVWPCAAVINGAAMPHSEVWNLERLPELRAVVHDDDENEQPPSAERAIEGAGQRDSDSHEEPKRVVYLTAAGVARRCDIPTETFEWRATKAKIEPDGLLYNGEKSPSKLYRLDRVFEIRAVIVPDFKSHTRFATAGLNAEKQHVEQLRSKEQAEQEENTKRSASSLP